MTAGNSLSSLKSNYHAAEEAVAQYETKTLIMGVSIAALGFIALFPISFASNTNVGLTVTCSAFVVSLFVVLSQYFMKGSRNLKGEKKSAHATYAAALNAEVESYGINAGSMVNHTDIMEKNHEFTAMRNGEPIDVTVREFNHEVVFMLDGKPLGKPVTI